MSVIEILQLFLDRRLAAEGITPEILASVDLTVEYTPVIPFAGGGLKDAVDVQPWGFYGEDVLPNRFEVRHPAFRHSVGREPLKVMRARYLLARDREYAPVIRAILGKRGRRSPPARS